MPVVVVGLAVWGGAALVAGGLTVMATIAAIGAVAGGVGVVTGNKDLQKIGAVMGLVGGVGALAESAGALASSSAGDVVANEAGGTVGAEQVSGPPPDAASTTSGAVAQQTMQDVVQPGTPQPVVDAAKGPAAQAVATQASAPAADALAIKDLPPLTEPPVEKSALDVAKEYADPMLKFAEKNQMLTYGMMQVGGAAIQGLFDTTKESQKAALDARANAENAQADYISQRTRNMSAPLPIATATGARRDVFSSTIRPTYNGPAPVGLLNSPVTGRPA